MLHRSDACSRDSSMRAMPSVSFYGAAARDLADRRLFAIGAHVPNRRIPQHSKHALSGLNASAKIAVFCGRAQPTKKMPLFRPPIRVKDVTPNWHGLGGGQIERPHDCLSGTDNRTYGFRFSAIFATKSRLS
jgi:hypothetical protein